MTEINDDHGARDRVGISRRTVMKGAAWSAPLLVAAVAAPAYAASQTVPKQFSSWGTTRGSRQSCGSGQNRGYKYTWSIDNSDEDLGYHGVLFPGADQWPTNSVVSDVINLYWLPFQTGTVTQGAGTSMWTTLAYNAGYGTRTGPGGVTYYAWETKQKTPVTVTSGMIDGNKVFHLGPDYQFSITGTECVVPGGKLYVSHAYTYTLNGVQMNNCSGSYNGNFCGGTGNYPSTTDSSPNWRNNGWVGSLAG
ncbi:MAG: hypothetical protein JSS74_03550 [Actinobacteria bacterium]|nr:hypothetical protein [Actinomycetota bacterium]